MEIQIALIVAVVAQFVAFFFTISLIPKTRFNIAWISISIGFLLMAIRRFVELLYFYKDAPSDQISILNSWIAVVISLTMLVASIYIRKIFEVLNRIHKLRKESEAKLLSAIIRTEEKERKYFSKELHDGLGPVLSSAKMTISAIDKTNISERNTLLLDKVENMVDNAIDTTREISNHLTPHVLERYGLHKAIENFINNIVSKESIKINLSSNIEKLRYGSDIEVILYRICCELINNTLKYAHAQQVDISINEDNNHIEFIYNDNGNGFDTSSIKKGMGIINIKSRVKSLNGTINITSGHNSGFNASIRLPL